MEGDYAISFLATHGYSTRLFESFGHHAHSTIEEAITLRGELRRRHVKRVILVTSDFHSRRSAIVFRLFCPGIDFISVPRPEPDFHADRWWADPPSKALFYSEWTKIFGTTAGLPKGHHRTADGKLNIRDFDIARFQFKLLSRQRRKYSLGRV